MKKRLSRDEIEYLKNNTSTGSDFNKQLMQVQIENLKAQGELKTGVVKLRKTIEVANTQGALTEKSNQRLQAAMFILTLVAVAIAIFGVSEEIYKTIGMLGYNLLAFTTLTTAVLTIVIMLFLNKEIKKWS